jgi:DNA-binding GntR family transcriptional regulator
MTGPVDEGRDPGGDTEVRASSKHLTRWVAQTLRGQIVSGELSPGDKLPSQNALEGRFNVSTVTVRNAVEELEDEGLIAKRQGAHTQVHNREPTHRLVIDLLGSALAGNPAAEHTGNSNAAEPHEGRASNLAGEPAPRLRAVAGPPVSFAPIDRRYSRLRRESAARQVPAAKYVASLLGLHEGDAVVERTSTLFYDEEPMLTSTSYLPSTLAMDMRVPNVEVGQLALEGYPVTSAALRLRTRMPDPREFERLAMVKGTPVQVLTHCVDVENDHGGGPARVRAAVEVVSRGDRVYVEIEFDVR